MRSHAGDDKVQTTHLKRLGEQAEEFEKFRAGTSNFPRQAGVMRSLIAKRSPIPEL